MLPMLMKYVYAGDIFGTTDMLWSSDEFTPLPGVVFTLECTTAEQTQKAHKRNAKMVTVVLHRRGKAQGIGANEGVKSFWKITR